MPISSLHVSQLKRCAVIGAGFAGLRAADILLQHGFAVTIFEARDRLGGRVAQSHHLGHLVDLGPNWIHGTENNPIQTLATATKTRLHGWDEHEIIYDSDGTPIAHEEAVKYGEILWDNGLIAEAFRYAKEHGSTIDAQKSLLDFFAENAESLFAGEPDAVRKRRTLLKYASMWGCYIGSPISRQSLRYYWLEECIEGENPFVAGTYQKILDAVAAPAKKNAEIYLDTEIVGVESVEPSSKENSGRNSVVLTTARGVQSSFDEVVVTVPLGVLKQTKTMFKPDIPGALSSAIDHISCGTLDKVYITFPRAFWCEAKESNQSLKGNDPEKKTSNETATRTPLHQRPASQGNAQSPSFFNWLEPAYSKSTNPDAWMQEAMNLAALPTDCAHPTLLFYIQGPQSKHIADMVQSAKTDAERDTKLDAFFKPYYSLLPQYTKDNPDCTPKAFLATAWANDRFAGYGSYCNFQIGLEHGDKDIETMRHGMPDRHVWLAGEHTAPFVALGTTTGAYWSGEAVARRIAAAHGM